MFSFLILLLASFGILGVMGNTAFAPSLTCPLADSFFDTTSYTCSACGIDMVPSVTDEKLLPACVCAPGFATLTHYPLTCTSCLAVSSPAFSDGSSCTTCDASSGASFSLPAADCICADASHILIETDSSGVKLAGGKACTSCPPGSSKYDTYTCTFCPDLRMTANAATPGSTPTCTCPSGETLVHSTCFPTTVVSAFQTLYSPAAYGKLAIRDVAETDGALSNGRRGRTTLETVEVSSHLLSTRFLYHALRCQEQQARFPASCHAVANMCVAVSYSRAHPACRFLATLTGGIPALTHGFPDWRQGMPWLFYSDASVLIADTIQTRVRLAGSGDDISTSSSSPAVERLRYVLVKYAYEGELLGVEDLTSQLSPCLTTAGSVSTSSFSGATTTPGEGSVSSLSSTRFLDFGTDAELSCHLDLSSLSRSSSRDVFYELFFLDVGGNWFPVPVKPLGFLSESGQKSNVRTNGEEVTDRADVQLVRRFYLAEALSSIPLSSTALAPEKKVHEAGAPEVFRYATSATLRVTVRDGSQQSIYPPLLVIEHGARRVTDFDTTSTTTKAYSALSRGERARKFSKFSFAQEYRNNLRSGEIAAKVFFALTAVTASLVWLVKVFAWQRRERSGITDFSDVFRVLVQGAGTFAEGIFWLMFGCSAYLFIFFKGQDVAHVLLPGNDSTFSTQFTPLLIFAFIGLFLSLLQRLVYQVSVDVMMIDWEAKDASQQVTFIGVGGTGNGNQLEMDLTGAALLGLSTSGTGSGGQTASVSAWRRVLVTNKWLELQDARRLHVPVTILLLLTLLHAIGLENLATAQPIANDLDPSSAPISPLLRFFVSSLLWLCVGGVQMVFQFVVLDLLQPPPTTKMIDLLASTNVSLCVFDHRYHMFYLHGKSVHDRADADFGEMAIHAARERRNLVRPRGLRGTAESEEADSIDGLGREESEACFSVFVSPELRAHYDNEYAALLYRHVADSQKTRRRAEIEVTPGVRGASEMRRRARGTNTGVNNTSFPQSQSSEQFYGDISDVLDAELARAQLRMNRFLCEFIDKSLPGHRYEIVPRGYVASWLDLAPVLQKSAPGMNIFAPDPSHTIKRTLMYGLDSHLLIFYCVLHGSCDALFNNTVISLLIVFAFDLIFSTIRSRLGRVNTAKKTVINERYLL